MQKSETIGALAGALAKAQAEIQGAKKDSENPFFKSKYADLSAVWDACRNSLTKNELAIVQTPRSEITENATIISLGTLLTHSSGEWIYEELSAVPVKDDPQGIGSCVTYLRRYALSAFTGVAPEDDDGNAASQPGQPQKAKASRKAAPENGDHTVEPSAEVLALRESIKQAMEALNNAGDDPQWDVPRVNKMVRDNFNGKRTVDLSVHELTDLAKMFSQRLEDVRKKASKERESLIASINTVAESEVKAYLKDNYGGAELESLTVPQLREMDKAVGIPF